MNFYNGKVIWVIGGTSGIGFSIAKTLSLTTKCTVVVSGRNVSQVKQSLPEVTLISMDVNSKQSFSNAVDDVLQRYEKVDIMLFCAGTYSPMNIDTFNYNSATNILQTNLGSMINFVENLPKFYSRCSTIGIISSVAGYYGMPNSLFYGASKAGLSHLTESLHIELKKHKIDVKLINPGFVKTPLTDQNSFKMPFIISADSAAKIILNKLSKNHFEIAFPFIFVATIKFFAKIPFKLRSLMFNFFG